MSLTTSDCYRILGLPRDASRDEVRDAYRRLVLVYHPERNPLMTQVYARIGAAYRQLMTELPEATPTVVHDINTATGERRARRGKPTDRRFELVLESHYLGTSVREVI